MAQTRSDTGHVGREASKVGGALAMPDYGALGRDLLNAQILEGTLNQAGVGSDGNGWRTDDAHIVHIRHQHAGGHGGSHRLEDGLETKGSQEAAKGAPLVDALKRPDVVKGSPKPCWIVGTIKLKKVSKEISKGRGQKRAEGSVIVFEQI